MKQKTLLLILTALMTTFMCRLAAADQIVYEKEKDKGPHIIEVKRIWQEAPHNAFTGLTRFKGKWFCTFREATNHGSMDGRIRIITSEDGEEWESAGLFEVEGCDLRDPKIYVTPDDNLLLLTRRRWPDTDDEAAGSMSMIWLSEDGKTWEGPNDIGEPDDWLWSITWHDNVAYSVGYGTGPQRGESRLYRSEDGLEFELINPDIGKGVSETRLMFQDDGTLLCLARAGRPLLARSEPPYEKWDWTALDFIGEPFKIIGGPDIIQIPDGRLVVGCRIPDPEGKGGQFRRTGLLWLDLENDTLERFLIFPSKMDTSYTGMVWHEDILWVSYYSSHEGRTSIYLAKINIPLQ